MVGLEPLVSSFLFRRGVPTCSRADGLRSNRLADARGAVDDPACRGYGEHRSAGSSPSMGRQPWAIRARCCRRISAVSLGHRGLTSGFSLSGFVAFRRPGRRFGPPASAALEALPSRRGGAAWVPVDERPEAWAGGSGHARSWGASRKAVAKGPGGQGRSACSRKQPPRTRPGPGRAAVDSAGPDSASVMFVTPGSRFSGACREEGVHRCSRCRDRGRGMSCVSRSPTSVDQGPGPFCRPWLSTRRGPASAAGGLRLTWFPGAGVRAPARARPSRSGPAGASASRVGLEASRPQTGPSNAAEVDNGRCTSGGAGGGQAGPRIHPHSGGAGRRYDTVASASDDRRPEGSRRPGARAGAKVDLDGLLLEGQGTQVLSVVSRVVMANTTGDDGGQASPRCGPRNAGAPRPARPPVPPEARSRPLGGARMCPRRGGSVPNRARPAGVVDWWALRTPRPTLRRTGGPP